MGSHQRDQSLGRILGVLYEEAKFLRIIGFSVLYVTLENKEISMYLKAK